MQTVRWVILVCLFSVAAHADGTLGLRYGIQSDRSQDAVADGTKLSLLLGKTYERFDFQAQFSHIGRAEEGTEAASLKFTTYELLAWAKYNFWINPWISVYSGLGAGIKIDESNLHLFDETTKQKSGNQAIGAFCIGATIPFAEHNKMESSAGGELQMISQPNHNFPELAFIVGLGLAFR